MRLLLIADFMNSKNQFNGVTLSVICTKKNWSHSVWFSGAFHLSKKILRTPDSIPYCSITVHLCSLPCS